MFMTAGEKNNTFHVPLAHDFKITAYRALNINEGSFYVVYITNKNRIDSLICEKEELRVLHVIKSTSITKLHNIRFPFFLLQTLLQILQILLNMTEFLVKD